VAETQERTNALTSTEPDRKPPKLRPRDAATLIIIDRTNRKPKVLMGRRSQRHQFMPGMFVFPGGRTEPSDSRMPVVGALHARAEQALAARVAKPSLQRGRALALAAVRETFEETGLLLGTREYGAPDTVPPGTWSSFKEHGIFPDLEGLQFVARAITPPKLVRRFDTRFFAVDRAAVAHEVPGVMGPDSELSELEWVTLSKARDLELPHITRLILEELEARIAAGFLHELPVPFFHQKYGRQVRETL
jgi:8-oxo-dGTP pyrophosphatase MutT (NUDIX family)